MTAEAHWARRRRRHQTGPRSRSPLFREHGSRKANPSASRRREEAPCRTSSSIRNAALKSSLPRNRAQLVAEFAAVAPLRVPAPIGLAALRTCRRTAAAIGRMILARQHGPRHPRSERGQGGTILHPRKTVRAPPLFVAHGRPAFATARRNIDRCIDDIESNIVRPKRCRLSCQKTRAPNPSTRSSRNAPSSSR